MNVTDIKVEENTHAQIDHILRLRNGRMYEIGCWIESDETLEELCDALIKDDPYRVVSISVYPKDKTIVRGITEYWFNMFMENFHDEEFSQRIGSLIALRMWDCWRNTDQWASRHFIEETYLELAESIFGKELVAKVSKNMALRAVEIMKQQALEHRQAIKKKQEAEEHQREEKRMKKHLKKLQKEGERIAKMTDEEVATAKVNADLEKDRLKKIQEQKDIAFAAQFIEKEVKVQPTKTKKEKKRGNPYQKMLTLSREAGIKTINPDWVKWESENK